MTKRGYEHIGRACALAVKLAARVDECYPLRSELMDELAAVSGHDAARACVDAIMCDLLPLHMAGKHIANIVESAEGAK